MTTIHSAPPKARHLTGPALLAGSKNFPYLEIPEIETEDGPGVVFFRPLSTRQVLWFTAQTKEIEQLKRTIAAESRLGTPSTANPQEVDDRQTMALHRMIALSVVDGEGVPLYALDNLEVLQDLDMRIFTRLSRAIVNLIRNRPLDYVEPETPAGEAVAPATVPATPTAPMAKVLPLQVVQIPLPPTPAPSPSASPTA